MTPASRVKEFFRGRRKRVMSFAGFGELGYEDAGIVARVAERVFAGVRTSEVLVNAGTLLRADGQNGSAETWGGFVEGGGLSPTLAITLDVTDELVVIGGGKHAADELRAFVRHGKTVHCFPAEMNREATREWCSRSGARIEDYRGDAHAVWLGIGKVE